ncbi:ESPR-type extended signal peptide-containing protein [Acidaminococcus massiliensis]|uniref:ESPR-type extended signal peptide-containing protein n=1 Tax=Acidaminococcus massiliensis TaxID=1852375 RepID=UPI00248EF8C2|nr:ESPR-type extended signal peptide-containing protein [Acidaminococcus massiliensis]
MNRIYKVIWNKTRGMYMVVSELAKGQSKDGRRAVGRKKVAQTAAALAVFFSIVSMGGTSFAADTTTVTDTEGKTQTVYTKDGVDSGIESLQEGIQKFSEQVQESLQKSQESIDEEAKKRKFSVTNLENADTAETAAREAADTEIKQAMTDQKTSTALHVTQAGNLIVGTKENQIVKNLKINGQLTAGSLSTGDIVSSGDVTVTGKMAADGVTDETTKDGTYIKQNNTVGNNLVSLDTQVKSNADAIEEEARKRKYSVTNLENADKQLQTNIDNEAAAREAADTALDTRITNVKEYLQQEVADTYVSKDDAAVQDGAIVKAANTIGDNVTKLDAALAKETADRLGADAAQDKVIQQVNDNLVASVNTINESVKTTNENMAAGFTALSQADANEAATREAADTEIKQAMTDQKTSTALHISSTGDLIVGTKENQTVKDMKIRGELTSGSLSTGDITSSGNVSVAGKVEAEAVYDDTTKTGNYVVQTNSVGANLSALDTQVKSNADAIEEEARKRKYSVTNLENADKQLQTNIDNEAATREAKDNELNERITNEANAIHETTNQLQSDLNTETAAREAADAALDSRTTALEDKTEAITYDKDSKTVMVDGKLTATEGITDGTTQDGQYVKADNYVGQNLNALDQGLQAETSARQAADTTLQTNIDNETAERKAADTTLQTNIDNEAAERKAADTVLDDKITAETSARVAADTKLVEAVNSGLSLSDDNVLQKNTTTIDAQGNVTTSKTDANEMILNKGKDNQITLNENGIKVGTNSSVMDANGVYTGGDTYSEAKAAMSADGSIKGADGKFTVNSANGTVNVNDQIELNGATGVVKSNGLNVGDGNFKVNSSGGVTAAGGKTTLASDGSIKAADGKFTVNSNGGVKAADGKITLSSDGSVKAADGKFTVNSDGGVKAADGKITLSSDGSLKAADGKFTVDSNGAVKAANGNTTIDSNGNLSTMGTVSAANGKFTVDTNGAITSTGLDAGNGTIQTTGTVKAGDVQTGTLETTGDATIGGNLTVDKNLTVNGEFNAKTLSSKLDENNYTTITGGKTQSVNLKMDTATGETKASASTFDETGSNLWAKDDDSIGKSTVTADGISQKLSDTGDNPTAYAESAMSQGTDNKYTMTDTVKDGDKTNVASQSATESSDVITEGSGDSAKTSTFRQKIDQILQEIKSANGSTSVEQTDVNITNTAKNGTITNEAQTLVNKATGDMTNTVGGKMLNDVTGDMENKVGGNLTTTVGGNETHTVGGTLTETVTGKATENYNGGLETTITGEEKHTVNGDQTNTITGKQTTTVTGDVTEDYKANLSTTVGGNQTTTVTGDSSLTAENITNEAKNKITNKALDVETDASSSIVSKVSNEYGSNTSTQLSYQTTEEMSQADGKKASYLRGAAEEKSQLTDGDKKTTVDTIAGQTNTNITDGTNTSNSLQKADQVASSVTDGTNTTVVNQDATSLASSITDGTKANNTNSTVDKSEQLIKASDTQYSATTKTATKTEDALVSGSSVIDVIKSLDDAGSPIISSAVTDGTNSTGVTQTAKDITNTAKNGTIANDAKDIINNAAENMTNTVGKDLTTTVGGEMKTTVTGKTTENYNGGLETTITGEEKHTVNGSQINAITGDQTNTIGGSQITTVTGDSSLSAQNITNTASETLSNSAKNITNTAAEKLSNSAAEIENTASKSITDKVGDNVSRTMTTSQIKESVVDGANSNTSTKTASKDMNIVTDGTSTSTLSQLAGSVNTSLKEVDSSGNSVKSLNNVQTVSEDTTKITDTATGDFSSRSQKANGFTSQVKNNSGGSNTVTDTATTSEQKLVSGNIIDILKDAETGYVNTTVSSGTGDDATSTSVKQGTADITNTAKQGTITNEAKNLVNKAEEKLSNNAAEIENTATTSIKDVVGKSTVTTTDTGTTFENTDHAAAIGEGSITQTTISGNTLETGKATADYVDVNKDLHVMGNTQLDGTLEVGGKSTFKDDVTMEKNLDVKGTTTTDKLVVNNGANITGGTTTDTLHVTSTATFDGMVTFKDAVSMEKDLTVGGNATVAGDVTAKSYKVGDKTYIDENGINANGQKITNVADGTVAEGSTDAVNGGQLNATNQRVTTVENRMDGVENRMDRVENRVDNLDNRIDKVGASAAAMANLHPMDFDEDSKVSVAAAMGSYRSETAGALGVFYRPTDRVMLNVSTSFGNGENMVGGGVSFKLGKSSKRLEKAEATNATLAKQVTNLQNRLDALLGVLNPSLSKDFPDVPANHWAYEAVSRLAGNNIVQGYEDGKYHGERTMTRYEMAEIIYNALSKGAKAEAKLVEEFRPELQAMAAQRKA